MVGLLVPPVSQSLLKKKLEENSSKWARNKRADVDLGEQRPRRWCRSSGEEEYPHVVPKQAAPERSVCNVARETSGPYP